MVVNVLRQNPWKDDGGACDCWKMGCEVFLLSATAPNRFDITTLDPLIPRRTESNSLTSKFRVKQFFNLHCILRQYFGAAMLIAALYFDLVQ